MHITSENLQIMENCIIFRKATYRVIAGLKGRTKFLSKLVWRETLQTSHIFLFLGVNFENLIVEFHIFYILNMHIKFHLNYILFIIQSINLFFIYNFKL